MLYTVERVSNESGISINKSGSFSEWLRWAPNRPMCISNWEKRLRYLPKSLRYAEEALKSQEASQASQKRCRISWTVSSKSGELGKRSGMGHTQRVKRVLSSVSKPEGSQKAARMSNLSEIVLNNEKGYKCVTKGFINDREHVTDTKIGRVSELLHTIKTVNNFGMVSHSHEGCQTSPGVSPSHQKQA